MLYPSYRCIVSWGLEIEIKYLWSLEISILSNFCKNEESFLFSLSLLGGIMEKNFHLEKERLQQEKSYEKGHVLTKWESDLFP